MFERGSAHNKFTDPTVTHTTVPSMAVLQAEHRHFPNIRSPDIHHAMVQEQRASGVSAATKSRAMTMDKLERHPAETRLPPHLSPEFPSNNSFQRQLHYATASPSTATQKRKPLEFRTILWKRNTPIVIRINTLAADRIDQANMISTISPEMESHSKRDSIARQSQDGPDVTSSSANPLADKVESLRRVFDRNQEPALFLPFLQKSRRNTAPEKAGPSLPIMVSTTVAVTTYRASSNSSQSSGSSVIVTANSRNPPQRIVPLSLSGSRDGSIVTPTRPPRNKLKKKRESPVKSRISLFENLNQSNSSASLPTERAKSHDSGIPHGADRKRLPGWEFKRGSRLLRVLSFGGKGNNGKERFSFLNSVSTRRESTFFVQGTMYKVPNRDDSPEKLLPPMAAILPATTAWSSIDLVNNTSETLPNLFHSTSTLSGRILPTRKSYGALVSKPDWEARNAAATFIDPFSSPPSSTYDPSPLAENGIPATIQESSTSPVGIPLQRHRSRYPSSFGRKAGDRLMKRSIARPVLTPDEGMAVPTRRSSLSLSWGRRAAAAAFAIGRRLKERRTSRSQSIKSNEGRSNSRAAVNTDDD
ncbi:hypothetical protein B0H67DRAFT_612446 [Lasiosphaeris hirsuta]|uniref:Uncharacterized protein n=1 Tax=Lasiosphaeris hirsuta TaxID=260670 RepID=A0AA40DLA8_9PEZI|nr:hypothetical protein B0H67DRAFT_612446 [Lasiosphaeris hirsuta]